MKHEQQIRRTKRPPCWNAMGAEVVVQNCASIPKSEQEMHIWMDRQGTALIDCSHRRWITKLSQNPLFEVEHLDLGTNEKILHVQGKIGADMITVRKKRRFSTN